MDMKRILFFALAVLALASCGSSPKSLLPSISGKAGEVMVVIDRELWEGDLGSEVRGLLAGECPYLATKEPLYNLSNVNPAAFADIFRVHRNILMLQVDPQVAEPGIIFKTDVWARTQCVIRISAATEEDAVQIVKDNGEKIAGFIEQSERNRVIGNTLLYEEASIAPQVREVMGGSPHFPMGYKLKKRTSDFVWVADEKQYTNQSVLLYRYPAVGDASDFEVGNIIANRNRILQENVPGMFEGTYMTTSEFIPPTVSFVHYKGMEFAQTRGYWEVFNDYMGGPFVSHSMYTPDGKEILVAEAFVYAPRYDKRQYLRQVEALLYSFEWGKKED